MKIVKTKPGRADAVFFDGLASMGEQICGDCDGAGIVEDTEGLVWNCPSHCKEWRLGPEEARKHYNWFWAKATEGEG